MYVQMDDIADVIHKYLVQRSRHSVDFALKVQPDVMTKKYANQTSHSPPGSSTPTWRTSGSSHNATVAQHVYSDSFYYKISLGLGNIYIIYILMGLNYF